MLRRFWDWIMGKPPLRMWEGVFVTDTGRYDLGLRLARDLEDAQDTFEGILENRWFSRDIPREVGYIQVTLC